MSGGEARGGVGEGGSYNSLQSFQEDDAVSPDHLEVARGREDGQVSTNTAEAVTLALRGGVQPLAGQI